MAERQKTYMKFLFVTTVMGTACGCPLYHGDEPADSNKHLVRGQSVHVEKVLEFYLPSGANSDKSYTNLPVAELEPLFKEPKWMVPHGLSVGAMTVGKVEPATIHWEDLRHEYTAQGYRVPVSCDVTVLPDAPTGTVTITVQFPKLQSPIGKDEHNNPFRPKFVGSFSDNIVGPNNDVKVAALRLYSSGAGRLFNLYGPWLWLVPLALIIYVYARWRLRRP
jgi:hypothetical protein